MPLSKRDLLGVAILLVVLGAYALRSGIAVVPTPSKPVEEAQTVFLNLKDPDTPPVVYLGISKLAIVTDHGAYLVLNRSIYDPRFFNLTLLINKTETVAVTKILKGNITYIIICIPEVRVQKDHFNHTCARLKHLTKVITYENMTSFTKNWTESHEKDFLKKLNESRKYIEKKGGFGMPEMEMGKITFQYRNRTLCKPDVPCRVDDLPVRYPACFIVPLNASIPIKVIPQPLNITIEIHVDPYTAITTGEAPVSINIRKG